MNTRGTDANRWISKLEKGNFQFIYYGWYADYPDPENFLALLYGPNGKVVHHGENYVNYDNPEYNQLFKKIEVMQNSPERASLIRGDAGNRPSGCTLDICLAAHELFSLSRLVKEL